MIPEELYDRLMKAKPASPAAAASTEMRKEKKQKEKKRLPLADAHLAEAEQRMEAVEAASNLPDDVKRKHVQQEFHRVQQLRKKKEAEPALVKVAGQGPTLGATGELPQPPPDRVLDLPPLAPQKRLPLSEDEEREANEILSYIAQNRERLGLSEKYGILQRGKHNRDAVKGSHVRLSVEYLVYKGVQGRPKPPGHATFLANIRKDPFLSARLQLGRGKSDNKLALALKRRYKSRRQALVSHLLKGKGVKKKKSVDHCFKPVLWK